MPHFIEHPNLPSGQVVAAAAGEEYAEKIQSALTPYGIRIISCPSNALVDTRLKSHIDLSVFHLRKNKFLLSAALVESDFAKELKALGAEIIPSGSEFSSDYPNDMPLCALALGGLLFHNLKYTDKYLLNCALFNYHNVNQGYTKCAVCPVNEKAVLTSDAGLAKVMVGQGIDVLKLHPGGIKLKGFNEGFIGGSAFKISPDKLAFTGMLEKHPDKNAIEKFLFKYEVEPIYLTSEPIFDIGSVIPILEI